MQQQYPLHILESRPNGAGEVWDAFTGQLKKSGQAAVSAALPHLTAGVQDIAVAKATEVVNMISALIPGEKDMVALGNRIVSEIESAINQNLLPQLYDRGTLGAPLLSDAELQRLYNTAITKVPLNKTLTVAGNRVTLNIRNMVQSALPYPKFVELARKIEPLATTVKTRALPVVETRIKDVALFTAMTGAILGGLVVFGYMTLYNSMD